MASDFKRVRYSRPKYSQKRYHMLMKMIQNSLAVEISDVAAFRLHVISHYYKYGLRPTLEAFKIKKSSLYNWRNRYEKCGKRVISLVPGHTRPLHVRKMETDWRVIAFMRETWEHREKYAEAICGCLCERVRYSHTFRKHNWESD